MEKDSKENEFATNTRQINRQKAEQQIKRKRDLIADAALRRQLKNKLKNKLKIKLKIKKPPSNPQQSFITPPSEVNKLELIRKRMQQKK